VNLVEGHVVKQRFDGAGTNFGIALTNDFTNGFGSRGGRSGSHCLQVRATNPRDEYLLHR
jgi:hypothetical protein